MNKLEQMIKISEGFTYSVNVQYDLENTGKLSSYIPTEKTIKILEDFIDRKNGSAIIVGSYGTGKSHLITLIANISSGKYKKGDYIGLVNKINSKDEVLARNFQKKLDMTGRRFLVLPSHEADDFEQSILLAIVRSLENEGLKELTPKVYFDAVIEKINSWEKDFIDVYNKFLDILTEEHRISCESFKEAIKSYNKGTYSLFKNIYPRLTGGAVFVPEHSYLTNIPELISGLFQELSNKGYTGIDIIFDEFGYFLEHNIDNINVDAIQSLAEFSNSNVIPLSLYFVAHKDFSQYSSKISSAALTEWRKVEGRFKRFIINQDSHDIYELISRVILKDNDAWANFILSSGNDLDGLAEKLKSLATFSEIEPEDISNFVVSGCYPINPLASYCLHKLSDKLAQSERTLFTFLSVDEKYSLLDFIKNPGQAKWLNSDQIFDYFEPLMISESKDSVFYRVWKDTKSALSKVNDTDILKKKIIKVLALIYMVNDFEYFSPNKQFLKLSLLGEENEIDSTLEELIKLKVIFYRKSLDVYKFFEGSDVDIEEDITQYITVNSDNIDIIKILNSDFLPQPILPRRYNDDYFISRYFVNEFINARRINSLESFLNYYNGKGKYWDGRIIYLIPEVETDIEFFTKAAGEYRQFENVVFVIPRYFIDFKSSLFRYQAINSLLTNEVFTNKDPFVKEELKIYEDEIRIEIMDKLANLLNNNFKNALIYNKGILLNIESKYKLQMELSDIADNCYKMTPKINNEMINRNSLSNTMKKVIDNIVLGLWSENTKVNLGFSEYSAEHTILKSVLLNTGIVSFDGDKLITKYDGMRSDNPLKSIYNEVEEFLKECKGEEKDFSYLVDILRKPPYGLRNGIIALLLSVALKGVIRSLYVKKDNIYQDINGKLIIDMVESPEKYKLSVDVWDEDRESYIKSMEEIFNNYIDQEYRKENRLAALYKGLKKYYISLPKYTRVSNDKVLSTGTLEFRNILSKDYNNHPKLFFDIIPMSYDFITAIEKIKEYKVNLDNFISVFRENFEVYIKSIFNVSLDQDLINEIRVWFDDLDENTANHLFDLKTKILMQYVGNPNKNDFIFGLIKNLTGFDINYLSDEIVKELKKTILESKNKVENFIPSTNSDGGVRILLEVASDKIARNFEEVKLSFVGRTLRNKIEDDIANLGPSIKDQEKVMILIDLLRKYM